MADSTSDNVTNTTRASLLIRLRDGQDGDAWTEFHDLYAPLLYHYARSRGLNHNDAEDVRSECYEALVRQLREFEYDRAKGSFKAWLRTMVDRRVIDRLRKRRELRADTGLLRDLPDNGPSDDEIWELEWERHHLRFCVEQVKPGVSEQTWNAFRMLTEENAPVTSVCETLSMNANQVYKAKAQMLALIRERLQDMLVIVE